MTKAEVVDQIANALQMPKTEVSEIVNEFFYTLKQSIIQNKHAELRGLGIFSTKTRKAHWARNPKTNERVWIPEHRAPYFKPGKKLKQSLKIDL